MRTLTLANELRAQRLEQQSRDERRSGDYPSATGSMEQAIELIESLYGFQHVKLLDPLIALAECYFEGQRYNEAESNCKRVLEICDRAGDDGLTYATSARLLARVYYVQRRFEDALPHCQRALAIRERLLQPLDPELANSKFNAARVLHDLARFEEAEPLYLQAIAIREKLWAAHSTDLANNLHALAEFYRCQQRYEEATPLLTRALSIYDEHPAPDTEKLTNILRDLASTEIFIGDVGQACDHLMRLLAIEKDLYGYGSVKLERTQRGLAILLTHLGYLDSAEALYRERSHNFETAFGPEDVRIVPFLNELALFYCERGTREQALNIFLRCLSIREAKLSSRDRMVGDSRRFVAQTLYDLAQYEDAEPHYLAALDILYGQQLPSGLFPLSIGESINDPAGCAASFDTVADAVDCALMIERVASIAGSLGRAQDAITAYEAAICFTEQHIGPDELAIAFNLDALGALYAAANRFDDADAAYHRAETIFREEDSEDPNIPIMMECRARIYVLQVKRDEAESLYREALAIREQSGDSDSIAVAYDLDALAYLYHSLNRVAEASEYYERSRPLLEKHLGENHVAIANNMANQARIYMSNDNLSEATQLLERAIAIRRSGGDTSQAELMADLDCIGFAYEKLDSFASAEAAYEEALNMRIDILGEHDPAVASNREVLARIYQNQNCFEAALPLFEKALEARDQSNDSRDMDKAPALGGIGQISQAQGWYSKAEAAFQRLLEISLATPEIEPTYTLAVRNFIGLVQKDQGHFASSEPHLRFVLEQTEQRDGAESGSVAHALLELARLLQLMGRLAEARVHAVRAQDICEKLWDLTQAELPPADLEFLASIKLLLGQYSVAEGLYNRSIETTTKHYSLRSVRVASALAGLAQAYQLLGKHALAVQTYHDAWNNVYAKTLRSNHPTEGWFQHNLALIFAAQGREDESETALRLAVSIRETQLGDNHPSVALTLIQLGRLLASLDRCDEAFQYILRCLQIENLLLGHIASTATEANLLLFLATLLPSTNLALTLIARIRLKESEEQALIRLLRVRRHVTAAAMAIEHEESLVQHYPEHQDQLNSLVSLQQRLIQELLSNEAENGADAVGLTADNNAETSISAELATVIPEINTQIRIRHASRTAVSFALQPKEQLLDFVRYERVDLSAFPARDEVLPKSTGYVALVLSENEPGTIRLVELADALQIDAMIATFREMITGAI